MTGDASTGAPLADEPEITLTVVLEPRNDGRKGYYGPRVELLCYDDGTVAWRPAE